MTDQPSPFAPFQPSPPISPEPAANTEKPARAKRRTKAEMAGEAPERHPSGEVIKRDKTGAVKLKHHAPKFDLQTTLAAAKLLNEDDFPMFEKLVIMFDEAGKPARDRVLAAIAKLFG